MTTTTPTPATKRFTQADRAALVALLREMADILSRDKRLTISSPVTMRALGAAGAIAKMLADDLTHGRPLGHHKPHLREMVDRWSRELEERLPVGADVPLAVRYAHEQPDRAAKEQQ
jgi:hypothetical protein